MAAHAVPRRRKGRLALLIPVLVLLAALVGFFLYLRSVPAPDSLLQEQAETVLNTVLSAEPQTADGSALRDFLSSSYFCSVSSVSRKNLRSEAVLQLSAPEAASLSHALSAQLNTLLSARAASAGSLSELYNDDLSYRADVLSAVFSEALSSLSPAEIQTTDIPVSLKWSHGAWSVISMGTLPSCADFDALASELLSSVSDSLEFCRPTYSIPLSAGQGSEPDPDGYLITEDPQEIAELLSSPLAQLLIGDEELCWRADRAFCPGRSLYCYLDETILVLIWKEEVSGSVGTFSEVFLSDASQLRRKLTNDAYRDYTYDYATNLAQQANAVLGLGGDYYCHSDVNGIMVWNGQLMNYIPYLTDTCYVDSNGDLHLYKIKENMTQEEVETYIKENNIMFSLIWGPILVRDGEECTPASYTYGEINDEYARAALGQLGHLHYLTLNVNWEDGYPYLVTMKAAAVAMQEHGCTQAYALDGGQTACTIFQGKLVNSIQFGRERLVGDILYFASARQTG